MENSGLKLILASTSPRRRELLAHLGIPFEIISEEVAEESSAATPDQYVKEIAMLKGDAVYLRLRQDRPGANLYVVAADTTVYHQRKIYIKPRDRDEARQFLSELSGQTHSVFTGVAVRLYTEEQELSFTFVDESRVTFNPISKELMERYLDTGDSLDKAGAYGIQGPSLTFISKVEGSYSNVVGFPLSRFVTESELFLKNYTEGSWLNLFQY